MTQNDLSVGRPSVQIPTTEQTATAAQTARSGKTTRGVAAENLTVKRASASPQYSTNVVAAGPELSAPNNVNATDLMAILFSLRQKHTESSIESAEQRIQDRSVDKETKSKEMIEKLQKVAHSKSDVGKTVGMVFAWIGVALSFVVAGVIGVVSGGAAAAPLLIIATMSAALLIAQQSGLTEKAMDAMGMDDKAKMGFSLGIAAVMLVINIAAVVVSGGTSAVGAVAEVTESVAEVAAAGGEAAAEAGATAASTAAEISSGVAGTVADVAAESAETAAEASIQITEAAVKTASESAETVAEISTQATTTATKAATESAETAAEISTQATEAATKATTESAETVAETATKVAENAAKTSADVTEKAATKIPSTAIKAIAGRLGTTSSRVLKVVDQVRSGIGVVRGGSEMVTGGLTIDSAVAGYKASKTRAEAMRDRATLTKMQAQDEEDVRRIRNMIEQLENAQSAVMSTISKSDEVALQIRQTI